MKKKTYRSLRGMPDILPEEAAAFYMAEKKAREVFRVFGFSEIRTPLLEETGVFIRSIGQDTDIVAKEMYSLKTKSGKDISLRPEGTASIIRAFIENKMYAGGKMLKLFYMGPMFRSERPQKGRLRQFHQIGAEVIGAAGSDVSQDIELITNAKAVLEGIGVEDMVLNINSLGCEKDREKYRKTLKEYLLKNKKDLCENCKRRISSNVLRVLDCKGEKCGKVIGKAPKACDSLCRECTAHYEKIKTALKALKIPFNENHNLVRGLDYYTGIVFEINHPSLGAQDAIAAGGRYDNLTRDMGGPDAGAIGYAIGLERVLLAVNKKKKPKPEKGVLVAFLGEERLPDALKILEALRKENIACELAQESKSLKAIMRKADKENRENVILIGEDEVKKGVVLLKDMKTGRQEELTVKECIKKLEKGNKEC